MRCEVSWRYHSWGRAWYALARVRRGHGVFEFDRATGGMLELTSELDPVVGRWCRAGARRNWRTGKCSRPSADCQGHVVCGRSPVQIVNHSIADGCGDQLVRRAATSRSSGCRLGNDARSVSPPSRFMVKSRHECLLDGESSRSISSDVGIAVPGLFPRGRAMATVRGGLVGLGDRLPPRRRRPRRFRNSVASPPGGARIRLAEGRSRCGRGFPWVPRSGSRGGIARVRGGSSWEARVAPNDGWGRFHAETDPLKAPPSFPWCDAGRRLARVLVCARRPPSPPDRETSLPADRSTSGPLRGRLRRPVVSARQAVPAERCRGWGTLCGVRHPSSY